MPEVEKASRRCQKVEGRFGIAARTLEDAAALARPFLGFLQVKEQCEPDCQVIVAQAARAILEIRFQMKNRVAKLGVPRASNFAKLLRNRVPFTQHQAGKHRLMQLLVEGELAGQESSVERCQCEFEVVRIKS